MTEPLNSFETLEYKLVKHPLMGVLSPHHHILSTPMHRPMNLGPSSFNSERTAIRINGATDGYWPIVSFIFRWLGEKNKGDLKLCRRMHCTLVGLQGSPGSRRVGYCSLRSTHLVLNTWHDLASGFLDEADAAFRYTWKNEEMESNPPLWREAPN